MLESELPHRKLDGIPQDWHSIYSADSDFGDEYFYFLSLRLFSLEDIYLKRLVDYGSKYMLNFKNLHTLFLRKNRFLTNQSIFCFNPIQNLERLNITRTQITLADLCEFLDRPSLREIFIDSDESGEKLQQWLWF